MIRIAICDDEKKILDEVEGYIRNYAKKENDLDIEVFRFDSAKTLISAIEDGKSFDIFVLDVYIGDEMGTALASDIRKFGIESPIIFATTSLEHAPQSYETGTLRYLIKPINPRKFDEALDAALLQVKRTRDRYLKFKTENGVASVNANHIMYSEAHDHYQYVRKDDGEEIKVRMTVTELFTILSKYGGFVRIGSAYIVNLRHVKNVTPTNVCLYSNFKIQIPRGKFTEIKNTFWNFQCEGQED
mgnify:FL=1